ncbi:MAG: cytochrome c-type biogenesis protein [Dehalococcoidia bacterium]
MLLVALWAIAAPGAQAQATEDLPPELEQRAHHLYRQVMCPTCVGQTIDQSRAPIAANMRGLVRERLRAGDTDEEILALFVDAYGESVLASPPTSGTGLFAWVIPPIALAAGGFMVFLAIRALRQPSPVAQTPLHRRPPSSGDESDSYLALVDEELGGEDERPQSTKNGKG